MYKKKKLRKTKKKRKKINIFNNIVDALVDDGYIIINNALQPQLLKNLRNTLQNLPDFKAAGITSAKIQDKSIRTDTIKWLDEDNASQSEYILFMAQLQEHLNIELFLGLKYYESHFAIYNKNDFYKRHLDAFKGSKKRVVTTVYYLSENWKEEDGGELIIYNEKNEVIQKVSPQANKLVIFLSENFPHEVLISHNERFSIAGWFRIDI